MSHSENPNPNPYPLHEPVPPALIAGAHPEQAPLELPPTEEDHVPLIRKEWSSRQRSLAVACGIAAVTSLIHMAEGEAHIVLDQLHGERLVAERAIDSSYAEQDPLAEHDADNNQSEERNSRHTKNDTEQVPETNRADAIDWFDLEKDLKKDENDTGPGTVPFKPDIPRKKLPFSITVNTPGKESVRH